MSLPLTTAFDIHVSRDGTARNSLHPRAVSRQAAEMTDDLTRLRAELSNAALACDCGDADVAAKLADVAIRRWRSFERRNKTNHPTAGLRVRDLAKGLRQGYPGEILYVPPGDLEHLAAVFAPLLNHPPPGG